jgi:hypothetical protein
MVLMRGASASKFSEAPEAGSSVIYVSSISRRRTCWSWSSSSAVVNVGRCLRIMLPESCAEDGVLVQRPTLATQMAGWWNASQRCA